LAGALQDTGLQVRLEHFGEKREDLKQQGGQGHGFILAARGRVDKIESLIIVKAFSSPMLAWQFWQSNWAANGSLRIEISPLSTLTLAASLGR
jgi:hypothetical protein